MEQKQIAADRIDTAEAMEPSLYYGGSAFDTNANQLRRQHPVVGLPTTPATSD